MCVIAKELGRPPPRGRRPEAKRRMPAWKAGRPQAGIGGQRPEAGILHCQARSGSFPFHVTHVTGPFPTGLSFVVLFVSVILYPMCGLFLLMFPSLSTHTYIQSETFSMVGELVATTRD